MANVNFQKCDTNHCKARTTTLFSPKCHAVNLCEATPDGKINRKIIPASTTLSRAPAFSPQSSYLACCVCEHLISWISCSYHNFFNDLCKQAIKTSCIYFSYFCEMIQKHMLEKGSKNHISFYTVIWKSGSIERAASEKCLVYFFINLLGQMQLYAGYPWK